MKKTYIALAASAAFVASGVAAADGVSVGVNHQVQVVQYSFDDNSDADGLYMADGGLGDHTGGGWNRISLKGSRDLENGMTAFVQVDSNQGEFGGAAIGGREVLAGLSGDFGKVRLGRMNTPYATSEPLQATFLQARGNGGRLASPGGMGNGSYRDGVIRYDNSFGGVKVDAALLVDTAVDYNEDVDAGTQGSTGGGNHAMSFMVSLPVGPANVYVANTAASDYTGWATEESDVNADLSVPGELGNDKQNLTKVGAVANMGNLRIQGEYEMVDEGFGANYGNFMFLSGEFGLSDSSSVVANYGSFASDSGDTDTSYMAVGYLQDIGTGTRLHAGYRSSTGDGQAHGDTTAIGAGLRVSF